MTALKQAVIATLFLLTALPASAQMGMAQRQVPSGVFNPVIGAGAVYETQAGNGPKNTVEYAIVGKESVNGKTGYWMEFTVSGTPMGDMVIKTLDVVADGKLVVSKTIMQMPDRPPMEMPSGMRGPNGGGAPADVRSESEDLGVESVTTPAGTFSCHHYRMKDGSSDTWVNESVPPFGLVKSQTKDSTTVLVKTLTGVKDKITGTPQPFNPMMMMPQSTQ